MGNVNMEASQIHYRGGEKPMSVEEAIKNAGSEITPEEKTWIDSIPALDNQVNGDATVYPFSDSIIIENAVPSNLADCNVKIEPVQDLHGYDHPWVGGANKNKINIADKASSTSGDVTASCSNGVITLSGTASAQTTFSFPLGSDINLTPSLYKIAYNNTASSSYIAVKFCNNGSVIHSWTPNVVNRVISDWTAAEDETIDEIKIEIATGYPTNMTLSIVVMDKDGTDTSFSPFANICPISGHTEVDVQRDGKNEADPSKAQIYDRYIILGGTTGSYLPDGTVVLDAGTYTASCNTTAEAISVRNNYETVIESVSNTNNITFTLNGTTPIRLAFVFSNEATRATTFQLEKGSTATPYEPYQGKTYTIALGDTIYGGTVDFDSGVMTVDRASKVFDGSVSEGWQASSSKAGRYFAGLVDGLKVSDAIKKCSHYPIGNPSDDNVVYSGTGSEVLRATFNTAFETLTDWTNYLTAQNTDGKPVSVVYELATPTTIQLTPQQIQLLQGQNTLTASTGDISVTVNGVSGSIGSVQEQVNDTDEALAELAAEIAEQLPTAPTTDGAYVLTVTVANGTQTYSWVSAT